MACYDDSCRIKNVLKNFFKIFLSLVLTFSPVLLMRSASASVNAGGWTLGDAVVHGATTTWNATKDVAGKVATGVASIKPTPAQVAKGILKGGLVGVALTAAQELIEGGVDFVLDPANNTIKYNKSFSYSSSRTYSSFGCSLEDSKFSSLSHGMQWASNCIQQMSYKVISTTDNSITYNIGYVNNEDVVITNISPQTQEKTIPVQVLASKVITLAEDDDAEAKAYVSAVAQTATAEKEEDQIVPMAQLTQALDASQTITDEDVKPAETPTATDTTSPTHTTSPTDTTDLPAFCTWAPNACAWFIWTKEKYDESVKAITDYFTEEPEEEQKDKEEIEEPEFEAEEVNLTADSQCPSKQVTFTLLGSSHTLDLPYQPVCDALEFFKPAILCVGAISSAFIVAGIRTKEEE